VALSNKVAQTAPHGVVWHHFPSSLDADWREQARASGFNLLSDDAIETLPPLAWLIDEMFPLGAFGVLYGEPGTGKSFVALSLAFAIARGDAWCGRPVQRGKAVYVAAEGKGGIPKRVRAWKRAFAAPGRAGVEFLAQQLDMLNRTEVDKFISAIRPLAPCFVIVDTLARCFGEGDENETKAMNSFVANVDYIRTELGAAVLVLHHTSKANTKAARGSSALRGAVDVEFAIQKKAGTNRIRLTCEKQKDSDPFAPILLTLDTVDIGGGQTSCVVKEATSDDAAPEAALLNETAAGLLRALGAFGGQATRQQWRGLSGCRERTHDWAAKALLQLGYVDQPARGVYRLTAAGEAALGAGKAAA
jgi:hypothetical protein